MKQVEYNCSNPGCTELHTATVIESLPERPLSYSEIDSLAANNKIQTARGHESFRIYRGTDDKYRETHTDMMVIVYDDIARLLRYIPTVGWAIEEEIEVTPNDEPETVVGQLFEDRERGVAIR